MSIFCPHCHAAYEEQQTGRPLVKCPSCGGEWRFTALDSTVPYAGEDDSTLVVPKTEAVTTQAVRQVDKFALEQLVGHGSFGDVWRARDTALDRTVAVKIPRRGDLSPSEAEYFLREARAAAQLNHPHIVAVHEAGESDGTIFIVSDFVAGRSLKDRLADRRLSTRESIELAIKVADALHHAHEAGVVHRDLKPGNIMLDAKGDPLVMDFGLAKRDTGEVTMTQAGNVLGTPAYMSPEQARGEGHAADRRADIYSLGVMLFEFLTGERPFRGDARMLMVQIANDPPPSPRKLDSRVPRDLETICMKCLETEPSRRFQTADELADDLRRWLEGKPLVSRPVSWAGRVWRWCARRPLVATLSALCAVLALAIVTGGPFLYLKERTARQFADEQKREAIDARNETQQSLARQAFDAAQLEGKRGRWREALKRLEAAEKAGFADKVELGFVRARALRSVAEFEKWSQEISRLEALPKTKAQRAMFLLLKAEQLRFQGKRDEGLKLIDQAIQLSLPKAQEAYAKGLIATTTPEAAEHFQTAVDLDPTFHEANSSLVATLALLGRLQEADLRARVAHRLFPEDPNYVFWLALMATLRQDKPDVEKWKRRLGDQMEPENARFVGKALDALSITLRAIIALRMPRGAENVQLLDAWFRLHQIQNAAKKNPKQIVGITAMFRSLINSIPPALSGAVKDFGSFSLVRLAPIKAGKDKRFNKALLNLTRIHPEGTVLWLHAGTLVHNKKYEEASTTLERVTTLPAMIPGVKPQAMYLAAVASFMQFQKSRKPADIRRAIELTMRRLKMGKLTKEEADLLRNIALTGRNLAASQAVVRAVLEQTPNDRAWRLWEIRIEFLARNYFRVINLANRYLKQYPNDREAYMARRQAATFARATALRFPKRFPAIAPKPKRRKPTKK